MPNHLLQDSYSDLLYVPNGHVYDGITPINVNNDNDTISIDASAVNMSVAAGTNIEVSKTFNLYGNPVYTINSPKAHQYSASMPLSVNNTTDFISIEPSAVNTIVSGGMNVIISESYNEAGNKIYTVASPLAHEYSGTNPIIVDNTNNNISYDKGTFYEITDLFASASITPTSPTFYYSNFVSLNPGQEMQGVLYVDNVVMDISVQDSWGYVAIEYDDSSIEHQYAKQWVNFNWGYNYENNTIVLPFYFRNQSNIVNRLDLKFYTGTRIATTSTIRLKFNGWIR